MKVYHVETQQVYDALMSELEEKGCKWLSGYKPTEYNYWEENKEDSCINILGKYIGFMNIERSKNQYPNIPIIEYKAKGENMLNPECKQCHKKWHQDSAKYCSWCGNKLVSEPEFKAGDYVMVDVNGRKITAKIDALRENKKEAHGIWYDKTKVSVKQDYWFLAEGNKFRHARPSEIAEYESALQFHKHGRKPFEVKSGDLIRTPSEKFTLILYPENYTKEEFLDYGWEFLKTVEEVNEWLENK